MKKYILILVILNLSIGISDQVKAGDFEWLNNLNVEATADRSGFRMRLATRFHIDDTQVSAVLNQMDSHADAYMVLRLGELSHRPIDDVVSVYRANKNRGWGRVAKDLGIKPGSKEFHALKKGHDLGSNGERNSSKKPKNKGKGKGKKNKHMRKKSGWSMVV